MYNFSFLKNIKIFILFSMLFLFLPAFYLPSTNIPIYDIVIGFVIVAFIFLYPRYFSLNIKRLFKYIHFKILLLFIAWVFFIGILFVILGCYYISHFLYATILLCFYNNFLWYIYPVLVFPKFFSIKFLIKFLFLGIYIVCVYGLLCFLFNVLGIDILNYIQNFINNRREEIVTLRVLSVFEEPSAMGGFICVNLSMLYKLIFSKCKIFNNNYLNIIVKRTYLIILILTIVCIQSPIWLPIFGVITGIHFSKSIINFIKKNFVVFGAISFLFLSILFLNFIRIAQIDVSRTVLNRIVVVTRTFSNWDAFVLSEGSLANRILSYYLRIKVWQKSPITGVGYKNTEYNLDHAINNSTLTLTKETNFYVADSYNRKGYIPINGSILTMLLSDTGVIGTLLYFIFVILNIRIINRILKSDKDKTGIEYSFKQGIRNSYISIIALSLYSININIIYFWFLYGLTNVFIIDNMMKGFHKNESKE